MGLCSAASESSYNPVEVSANLAVQAPLPWGLEALKNFAWRGWWAGAANAVKLTLG